MLHATLAEKPLADAKLTESKEISAADKPSEQTPKTLLALLDKRKKQLPQAAQLIQRKIHNRKILVCVLMGGVMVGTAAFVLYRLYKYKEFRAGLDSNGVATFDSLSQQLIDATSHLDDLEFHRRRIEKQIAKLSEEYSATKKGLDTKISVRCFSQEKFSFGDWETRKCSDLLSHSEDFNLCHYQSIPDCNIEFGGLDFCTSVIKIVCEYSSIPAKLKVTEQSIHNATEIVTLFTEQMQKLFPGKEAFYQGIGGLFFILYWGEIPPAAIILLHLLTSIISEIDLHVSLNTEEKAVVLYPSNPVAPLSYGDISRRLNRIEQATQRSLDFQTEANKYFAAIREFINCDSAITEIICGYADLFNLSNESPDALTEIENALNPQEEKNAAAMPLNGLLPFWQRTYVTEKKEGKDEEKMTSRVLIKRQGLS